MGVHKVNITQEITLPPGESNLELDEWKGTSSSNWGEFSYSCFLLTDGLSPLPQAFRGM